MLKEKNIQTLYASIIVNYGRLSSTTVEGAPAMIVLYEHMVCLDCATLCELSIEMNDEHTKRYKEAQATRGHMLTYVEHDVELDSSTEPCTWCKAEQAGPRYLGIVHTEE